MSEYIKVIFVVIVCCLLISTVKEIKNEYSIFIALFCGLIVLFYAFSDIRILIEQLNEYTVNYGINQPAMKIFIKSIGISIICQFASEVCSDTNNRVLQFSVELVGKTAILITSLPLVNSVMKIVANYINM